MFEPPMEYCPVCGEYVVLVQPQADCARRARCAQDAGCPLRRAFAATDYYRAAPGDDNPAPS